MAAEHLQSSERKATVILVSDGEETCNADPCALGAELEKLGVDFTAHVVGFDLPQGKARAQLQCLAKSTGGRYVEARDAAELNNALGELAQTSHVMTEEGAELTGLGAVLSSYIYFGTYAQEEDTLPGGK